MENFNGKTKDLVILRGDKPGDKRWPAVRGSILPEPNFVAAERTVFVSSEFALK